MLHAGSLAGWRWLLATATCFGLVPSGPSTSGAKNGAICLPDSVWAFCIVFPNSVKGFGLLRLHTPKMSFTPITFGALIMPHTDTIGLPRGAPRLLALIGAERYTIPEILSDFI